ncbi:MAG: hypothetical protein LUM44_07330 [Pyrinomonadaceae bacterium]|nr:hypothetical protein [Pyrinomonadaceae bacterium]
MIAALAGRRIDAPNAEKERFPLEMKDVVYKRILECFSDNRITTLVSSAACGADLLAQKAARELKIDRRIILPFNRVKFRKTSVTDRPGNWGELFDEICDEAKREGKMIFIRGFKNNEEKAYAAVTTKILKRAKSLRSEDETIMAVAVWEGTAKNESDETASFIEQAKKLNIRTEEILTKQLL